MMNDQIVTYIDNTNRTRIYIFPPNAIKIGCVHRRIFDGSFPQFSAPSSAVTLYPYQKDAVARILFSRNTLRADVIMKINTER